LTGRAGRYSIGIINVQTGDESPELRSTAQATNFSVVRLKRDILGRSAVGLIATARSVTQSGVGRNFAYGVDGTFAFFENLAINETGIGNPEKAAALLEEVRNITRILGSIVVRTKKRRPLTLTSDS
jgi:hypothetical protein